MLSGVPMLLALCCKLGCCGRLHIRSVQGWAVAPGCLSLLLEALTLCPCRLPQMCQDFLDCGECFHYRCPRAHGEVGAAGLLIMAGRASAVCIFWMRVHIAP